MAKFVFRLASLLSLKEKIEDQKEMEYGQAVQLLEEEKRRASILKNRRVECIEEFKKKIESDIDTAAVARYNAFLKDLSERIERQDEAVRRAERFVEQKRQELVEAMRERKTYEKLKEKDYETFVEEEKHAEEKETDIVVSYRYSR